MELIRSEEKQIKRGINKIFVYFRTNQDLKCQEQIV